MSYAGLFESFDEVEKPVEAEIQGALPTWLNGTLLRNGPGKFEVGDDKYKHLFDGLAYLQRYHFEAGKLTFKARFLRSESYRFAMAAKRIVVTEYATAGIPDICKTILGPLANEYFDDHLTDNASVNFFAAGDTIWAVTETPKITRIDPESLDVLEKKHMSQVVALHTFTAHQQLDPEGNVYHIGTRFGPDRKYVFAKTTNPKLLPDLPKDKCVMDNTVIIGEMPVTDPKYPCYYHSFAMTENYCVLFEAPLRFDVDLLLRKKELNGTLKGTMKWFDDQPTLVRVLDKRTGAEVAGVRFEHAPFFSFHQANAYEIPGFIIMDYCATLKTGTTDAFLLDNIRANGLTTALNGNGFHLYRLVIPVDAAGDIQKGRFNPGDSILPEGKFPGNKAVYSGEDKIILTHTRLSEEQFEFPRVNFDLIQTKKYRFVYGCSFLTDKDNGNVVKVDVESRKTTLWKNPDKDYVVTEPVFVPTPGATVEDDGVLLVPVVSYSRDKKSYLLVLNAETLDVLAKCILPVRLPLSFHGQYYDL